MTVKNEEDVIALKRVGRVVSLVLQEMLDALEPGMTTRELDDVGRAALERHGARSAPEIMYAFPGATCISINEEAAHGVPGGRIVRAGDVVNIDVSAEMDGYFADTGATGIVPPSTPEKDRLCYATRLALDSAVRQARAGNRITAIGKAAQQVARSRGFKVIKNLAGHGVGRSLHEEPEAIVGYYEPRDRRVLHEGMVIAIEPFLSTKSTVVEEAADGWTLVAERGNLSAQYEHTVIVTHGSPIVLTAPR